MRLKIHKQQKWKYTPIVNITALHYNAMNFNSLTVLQTVRKHSLQPWVLDFTHLNSWSWTDSEHCSVLWLFMGTWQVMASSLEGAWISVWGWEIPAGNSWLHLVTAWGFWNQTLEWGWNLFQSWETVRQLKRWKKCSTVSVTAPMENLWFDGLRVASAFCRWFVSFGLIRW